MLKRCITQIFYNHLGQNLGCILLLILMFEIRYQCIFRLPGGRTTHTTCQNILSRKGNSNNITLYCLILLYSLLEHQLVEPINWLKTIQNIFKENGSGSIIYEVGPGKQLRSMISRINKSLMNDFRNLGT